MDKNRRSRGRAWLRWLGAPVGIVALVAAGAALTGCAPAAGTEPDEMSTAGHEQAAMTEDQAAEMHQGEYSADARVTQEHCTPTQGKVCWTSSVNPTDTHYRQAEQHRTLAAEHRAASQELRAVEARECAGLDATDRDQSPFAHREDIRSVRALREPRTGTRAASATTRAAGAEIVFRAVPGLTAEWLQRIIECHLARNAALGHEEASEEMPWCPLTLAGVESSVRSVGDGFAVDLRSADEATASEILRRAEALTSQP